MKAAAPPTGGEDRGIARALAAMASSPHEQDCLKGASHEIEMGRIWYQKKDLEKLKLRG